jgi:methionyl-tRNA formyltransferase
MNVIFFGGSEYVIPIVRFLKNNFSLNLVVTTEKNRSEPIITFCHENKIPFLSISSLSDPQVKKEIISKNPTFAILANFRFIIPKDILMLFSKGIINIHPSYLPKYRGPTPGQTAILNGDKTTGVSIIKLDEKIDHGGILAQENEEIHKDDTSKSLYLRLFKKGAAMLENLLDKYLNEEIKLKKQDDSIASFTKILKRDSGYVNLPSDLSFESLDRKVRAYFPWPGVWTNVKLNNRDIRIKLLPKDMLQIEGKKAISFKDFINGYYEGKNILNKLRHEK